MKNDVWLYRNIFLDLFYVKFRRFNIIIFSDRMVQSLPSAVSQVK